MLPRYFSLTAFILFALAQGALAQSDVSDLSNLTPGRTVAQNALWIENELSARFNSSKRVVVAEIAGPATITMMHFAFPQSHVTNPPGAKLNRDLLLKIYWDGETEPSVDCPLVDFFCDPAGTREQLSNALLNKRRGWNAYFPMPFRKSARVELVYDGPLAPGEALWSRMPCYSYVMYRTLGKMPETAGYFHASWRQEALLLGQRDYLALDAKGKGKFVGWNVTVRQPGYPGYPVDENEKFFIDGQQTASVEFQGLEDSFGFSWGFPESESIFPMTGYFPFLKGACAYRLFLQDSISFEKSLRVTIGFGEREDPIFRKEFSKPGNRLQFSTTVYWYQTEPHAPLPAIPPSAERAPAPEDRFWPDLKDQVPSRQSLKQRGVKLEMFCGRPGKEIILAEPGYAASVRVGEAWDGWTPPMYHCRSSKNSVEIEVAVPPNVEGTLRAYVIDADNFQGGRKQTVSIAGKSFGSIEHFQEGRWIERPLTKQETAAGKVLVRATNENPEANAVVSIIEWVEKK
jgi:hypothetical protein